MNRQSLTTPPKANPSFYVAVLAIPIYAPANIVEFENIFREVLATAASYNKTKLIIDLRGNGGGYVSALFDSFRQL